MVMVDLEPASRRMAEVVAGVPDDLLDAPTPCADYTLGDLIDHIDGMAFAFTRAASKTPMPPGGPEGPRADASNLGDDWRSRIPEALAGLTEAWREPEAWTGMTRAGGVDLPGEVAGLVALEELVLHGWDIARASGQSVDYDDEPELLEVVHGVVVQFTSDEAPRDDLYGPPVPVPDDAPLLDRVLGLAGRDPAWSAPS